MHYLIGNTSVYVDDSMDLEELELLHSQLQNTADVVKFLIDEKEEKTSDDHPNEEWELPVN